MGGDELDGVGPSGVLPDYGLAGRVPLVQAGRRVGHGNRMRDHEHRRCERRQRGHHADADDQHNRPVAGDGQARSPGGRFKRRRRRAGAHGRCLGRYRRCQRDTCRQGDDGRRESSGRKLAQRVQIRRHATGGGAKPAAATTGATAAARMSGSGGGEDVSPPSGGVRSGASMESQPPQGASGSPATTGGAQTSSAYQPESPAPSAASPVQAVPESAASAASSAPPMPSTAAPRHAASNPPLPSGARATGVPGASAEPQGARNGKAKQEHGKEF